MICNFSVKPLTFTVIEVYTRVLVWVYFDDILIGFKTSARSSNISNKFGSISWSLTSFASASPLSKKITSNASKNSIVRTTKEPFLFANIYFDKEALAIEWWFVYVAIKRDGMSSLAYNRIPQSNLKDCPKLLNLNWAVTNESSQTTHQALFLI